MTMPTRHISTSIARPFREVYEFASHPENLPRWAAGLTGAISNIDGAWIAESGLGKVRIQFAAPNEFGVLDHTVTLASGETFDNPMRTFRNGDGSEVVFTLFRRAEVDDEAFETDAAAIARDLATLKALMES
ncbi:SRPBCC family protein [Parafrigoribacterium mesophilum]|uniref:SRPBCC family protein n=1 Tax=Parafrigoribacterium mesophilum TaxID=433646 RepID=UPI0031FC0B7C